ncbi:MAG: hypothetical protein ABMA15_19700 [Vicinamibacterales bacterium]
MALPSARYEPHRPAEGVLEDRAGVLTFHLVRGLTALDVAEVRRAFGFDVLVCSRYGARLRLVALIEEADTAAMPSAVARRARRSSGTCGGSGRDGSSGGSTSHSCSAIIVKPDYLGRRC